MAPRTSANQPPRSSLHAEQVGQLPGIDLGVLAVALVCSGAIRENTEALNVHSGKLDEYVHANGTRTAVIEKNIGDLRDWRRQVEATNRTAAPRGNA